MIIKRSIGMGSTQLVRRPLSKMESLLGLHERGQKDALCSGLDAEPVECSLENLFVASARGPTLDGRIKPDVVFPGEQIVSARSSGSSAAGSYGASCKGDPRRDVHVFSGTVSFP